MFPYCKTCCCAPLPRSRKTFETGKGEGGGRQWSSPGCVGHCLWNYPQPALRALLVCSTACYVQQLVLVFSHTTVFGDCTVKFQRCSFEDKNRPYKAKDTSLSTHHRLISRRKGTKFLVITGLWILRSYLLKICCSAFLNLMHFTSQNCKCTLYINISLIRLLQFGTYSYFKEGSGDRLEQNPTNYSCILFHIHPSQKWKALVYKIQTKGGYKSMTGSLNPYNLSWLFSWVQWDKEQP